MRAYELRPRPLGESAVDGSPRSSSGRRVLTMASLSPESGGLQQPSSRAREVEP